MFKGVKALHTCKPDVYESIITFLVESRGYQKIILDYRTDILPYIAEHDCSFFEWEAVRKYPKPGEAAGEGGSTNEDMGFTLLTKKNTLQPESHLLTEKPYFELFQDSHGFLVKAPSAEASNRGYKYTYIIVDLNALEPPLANPLYTYYSAKDDDSKKECLTAISNALAFAFDVVSLCGSCKKQKADYHKVPVDQYYTAWLEVAGKVAGKPSPLVKTKKTLLTLAEHAVQKQNITKYGSVFLKVPKASTQSSIKPDIKAQIISAIDSTAGCTGALKLILGDSLLPPNWRIGTGANFAVILSHVFVYGIQWDAKPKQEDISNKYRKIMGEQPTGKGGFTTGKGGLLKLQKQLGVENQRKAIEEYNAINGDFPLTAKSVDGERVKKPSSSYMFFNKARSAELRAADSTLSMGDVSKAVARAWKELSDDVKAPFVAQATADKARYEDELSRDEKPRSEEITQSDDIMPFTTTKDGKNVLTLFNGSSCLDNKITEHLLMLFAAQDVAIHNSADRNQIQMFRVIRGKATIATANPGKAAAANTVVVIGGGIAGLSFALFFKRRYPEKNVIVLERRLNFMERCQVLSLWDITFDLLVGKIDKDVSATHKHRAKYFYTYDKGCGRLAGWPVSTFDLQYFMYREAKELGVDIRTGMYVSHVTDHADGCFSTVFYYNAGAGKVISTDTGPNIIDAGVVVTACGTCTGTSRDSGSVIKFKLVAPAPAAAAASAAAAPAAAAASAAAASAAAPVAPATAAAVVAPATAAAYGGRRRSSARGSHGVRSCPRRPRRPRRCTPRRSLLAPRRSRQRARRSARRTAHRRAKHASGAASKKKMRINCTRWDSNPRPKTGA